MIKTKLFGKVLKNYSYITLFKWIPDLQRDFLKNPLEGSGHGQNALNQENNTTLNSKTFKDLQLCFM